MKLKNITLILCALFIASVVFGFEIGPRMGNKVMMSPYPDGGGGGDPFPNLRLTVSYSPINFQEGDTISFTMKAENDGTAPSDTCTLAILKSDLTVLQSFDVPSINPGATLTFNYNWTAECGTKLEIWLDRFIYNESNTEDNEWSKKMNCGLVQHSLPENSGNIKLWEKYKLSSDFKNIKLPIPCLTCAPWHNNLRQGDPVDLLNNIVNSIAEGKGLAEVEADWHRFLAGHNGLNPNSALRIIFDGSVKLAKVKLQTEAEILNFQKNLTNLILGLRSITEMKLSSK